MTETRRDLKTIPLPSSTEYQAALATAKANRLACLKFWGFNPLDCPACLAALDLIVFKALIDDAWAIGLLAGEADIAAAQAVTNSDTLASDGEFLRSI